MSKLNEHDSKISVPGQRDDMLLRAGAYADDGTRNGPIFSRNMGAALPAISGRAPVPGRSHHYVFEFYALDTKPDLPANTTRDELLKAP